MFLQDSASRLLIQKVKKMSIITAFVVIHYETKINNLFLLSTFNVHTTLDNINSWDEKVSQISFKFQSKPYNSAMRSHYLLFLLVFCLLVITVFVFYCNHLDFGKTSICAFISWLSWKRRKSYKKFKNLVHIFSIAKRIEIDQNDTIRPEKSAIFESVTIKSEEQVLK